MSQAVTDLLYLGQRLKGLLEIVPELEKISSLPNHIAGMEEVLKKQKDEYEAKVLALKDLQKQEEDFLRKAEEILDKAKKDAEEIISKANSKFKEIVSSAKTKADSVLSEVTEKVNQKKADLASLEEKKNALNPVIISLEEKYDSLKSSLDDLKRRF